MQVRGRVQRVRGVNCPRRGSGESRPSVLRPGRVACMECGLGPCPGCGRIEAGTDGYCVQCMGGVA